MHRFLVASLAVFSTSIGWSSDCQKLLTEPYETLQFGEMRQKSIQGWDKLLTWALTPKNVPYPLIQPPKKISYSNGSAILIAFNRNYGNFSIYHPIVGIVSDAKKDIEVTRCLLRQLPISIQDPDELAFATDEVLCKVLAYRDLKTGMVFAIPARTASGKFELVDYRLDNVIDMWHGMPAYGFVPVSSDVPPILIYRGTDLSITSAKGWASILSDLDTTGPGHTTFLRAHEQIRTWLTKMHRKQTPPRLVGFSLGGAFVFFTMIYDYDLITLDPAYPSKAFNPPGLSDSVYSMWEEVPDSLKAPHITYLNQGDFVSQIGLFPSNTWEVTIDHPMLAIEAHLTLIFPQKRYSFTAINVPALNAARK